ncbi:MAG: DNA polymerase III subunit gamma/tau [Alteromonadaceae bacterium]|nr:MAG: DNA polymerase III subunit gamma/tau [Alteromonadaceae bacterium]
MSYQVLARKWRPRVFREMVGQEHVLKALINALDHGRLHHAYLFTGTRGVGKTTIARILAKCLNCETGVTSEPCDTCSACTEISQGRFIDLIEVDAASRTKVEDTRELLDNVQYAPTRGRYKIYLIDEVHMLSNHSFNALLKTLEEPPEHVKFLLATTDPQKLPVTILSRCLQFNLKNMSPERIVGHLGFVLKEELIPYDEAALWQLARSADGSMRDALSLTDQAISFGGGSVVEKGVASMLGTIDQVLVKALIDALVLMDGGAILLAVANFSEHAPDYGEALADLLSLLHRVAVAQALPEALDNSHGDRDQILAFAQQLAPEDVQLFYQTALIGRRDLPLASDPRSGFEMTMLRMLAFKPQGVADVPRAKLGKQTVVKDKDISASAEGDGVSQAPVQNTPVRLLEPETVDSTHDSNGQPEIGTKINVVNDDAGSPGGSRTKSSDGRGSDTVKKPQASHQDSSDVKPGAADVRAMLRQEVKSIVGKEGLTSPASKTVLEQNDITAKPKLSVEPASCVVKKIAFNDVRPQSWLVIYRQLNVKGVMQSTVQNCALIGVQDNVMHFILDEAKASLFDPSHTHRLTGLLCDYFSHPIKVDVNVSAIPHGLETPAASDTRERLQRASDALASLKSDPIVQTLEREFGAQINSASVTSL